VSIDFILPRGGGGSAPDEYPRRSDHNRSRGSVGVCYGDFACSVTRERKKDLLSRGIHPLVPQNAANDAEVEPGSGRANNVELPTVRLGKMTQGSRAHMSLSQPMDGIKWRCAARCGFPRAERECR
jgi:hypothetical protein